MGVVECDWGEGVLELGRVGLDSGVMWCVVEMGIGVVIVRHSGNRV